MLISIAIAFILAVIFGKITIKEIKQYVRKHTGREDCSGGDSTGNSSDRTGSSGKDRKEEDKCHYSAQLNRIEQKTTENEKAIVRLQLIYLIHEQPHNRDTILKTAQRYFIDLDGNGEAWAIFDEWARDKSLDIGWYKMLIERKEKKDVKSN